MGSTTFKPRKATFTVTTTKQGRKFSAVNRRAHIVARKAGKRSILSVAELKTLKGTGSYKFYFYDASGVLKPIKF